VTTTPVLPTETIRQFCQQIVPGDEARYVPFTLTLGHARVSATSTSKTGWGRLGASAPYMSE
jgi:hypothetical protein